MTLQLTPDFLAEQFCDKLNAILEQAQDEAKATWSETDDHWINVYINGQVTSGEAWEMIEEAQEMADADQDAWEARMVNDMPIP